MIASILASFLAFSTVYETAVPEELKGQSEMQWGVEETEEFDELVLAWNAPRTTHSRYTFLVSLRQGDDWSPWLYYGEWGNLGQMLPQESPEDSFAGTSRGFVRPKEGKANGFRLKVLAPGKERLSKLNALFATLSNLTRFEPDTSSPELPPVFIEGVPRQSLNTLRLDRHWDMSMVACMLSATRYLGNKDIGTDDYARFVMDNDFESYDFWPLHAAEGYHRTEGKYRVFLRHLENFQSLHAYLMRGCPVLVDILGTPAGGLSWPPYRRHILCVIGYDAENEKVQCLDPVFPNNKAALVSYSLWDFQRVWAKRQNIACVFERVPISD